MKEGKSVTLLAKWIPSEKKQLNKIEREELWFKIKDWKENIFPVFKVPALQMASVSVIVFTVLYIEKYDSIQSQIYYPISTEVNDYGFQEESE
jgi:hypothetical protein